MKRILVLLAVTMIASVMFGAEAFLIPKDSGGQTYQDFYLRGAEYTKVTATHTATVVGTNDVILYDIFAVTTSSATNGSVALTNTAGTAITTLDIPVLATALLPKSRSIATFAFPVRFTAGLKAQITDSDIDTTEAGITLFFIRID